MKSSLFKKYPIVSLGFFGSVARNEAGESSDLDVLVEFSRPVGLEFLEMADELEARLQCKIDLVSRKGIKNRYFEELKNDLIYV